MQCLSIVGDWLYYMAAYYVCTASITSIDKSLEREQKMFELENERNRIVVIYSAHLLLIR